jgi:hypothetical protein
VTTPTRAAVADLDAMTRERQCVPWASICEDIGLPVRDDWY